MSACKFGEALRQARASNFDLPVALGLQLSDRVLKIILNKPGVGADRRPRELHGNLLERWRSTDALTSFRRSSLSWHPG